MKRHFLTLSLMGATLLSFAAEPSLDGKLSGGTGTEKDPYLISTVADVETLAKWCNVEDNTRAGHYEGLYFKLTADIDMSTAKNFLGIATAPSTKSSGTGWYFGGKFDGQGHKIKNMTIKGLAYEALSGLPMTGVNAGQSRGYVGFFGNLKNAEIKNLIIDSSCKVEGAMICGGIAGNAQTGTTITNCENSGTIMCYGNMAGGIVGQANPTAAQVTVVINNCLNAGTVWCNKDGAGGIVGKAQYMTIEECVNTGTVKAFNFNACQNSNTQNYAGGIFGNSGGGVEITNCINYGDVYAEKEFAGGIMAYNYYTSKKGAVSNCINTGHVSSRYYSDGNILGKTYTSASMQVPLENCYYDNQINNVNFQAPDGCSTAGVSATAMTTTQLTSGALPAGLDSKVWTVTKGYYPILTYFKDHPAVKAAAASYLVLPTGQDATRLIGSATFSTTMTNGSAVASEGTPASVFKITSNSVAFADPNEVITGDITLKNGTFSRTVTLTTFPINLKGSGTEADPYQIASAADIEWLAKTCNKEARYHWDGAWFKLTTDIDMSSLKDFKGIASESCLYANAVPGYIYHFNGSLDGAGHTISNMTLNTVVYDEKGEPGNWTLGSYNYTGLIGSIGGNVVIKNLTLDKTCKITSSGTTGGLVAYQKEGNVKILNCEVAAQINSTGSMVAGLFGYCDKKTSIAEINNCVFSGTLTSNNGSLGGIVSTQMGIGSKIVNCANVGAITLDKQNGKASFTVSNCGAISAQGMDSIMNCVNYGPFTVNVRGLNDDEEGKQISIERIAGITGMASSSEASGTLLNNINVGQLTVKGGTKISLIGAVVGNVWHKADFDQKIAYNYADTTLLVVDSLYGGTNATLEKDSAFLVNLPKAFIASTTAELTSGKPVKGLENDYVFEAGYYPIPKGLENNKSVRAAAATFFNIPAGQSVRGIKAGEFSSFNTAMELKGEVTNDKAFAIETFEGKPGLRALGSDTNLEDVLTLRNGDYYNFYPLVKIAGEYVGIEEIAAEEGVEIDNVVYYNLQGQQVSEAEEGAVTIAVISFVNGTKKVAKIVK